MILAVKKKIMINTKVPLGAFVVFRTHFKTSVMKNRQIIISLCIFLFSLNFTFAQDIIIKQNGDSLKTTIQTVNPETISYLLDGMKNNIVFTINKDEIAKVIYRNGIVENFNTTETPKAKSKNSSFAFKKNLVSIDALGLGTGSLRISYERLLQENFGLKIPISYNYYKTDFNNFDLHYYSGLEINFYPTGQGVVRYFVGPALHFGLAETEDYHIIFVEEQGHIYERHIYEDVDVFFSRFLINNGLIITPIDNFSISMISGLGVRFLDVSETSHRSQLAPNFNFSVNISLRF